MPPETDRTDLLDWNSPPPPAWPQQPPAAVPPAVHPQPRRVAEGWYRANVLATYTVWSLAAALALWLLAVLFVASWKAR